MRKFLFTCALVLPLCTLAHPAQAVPFSPDVVITGGLVYDTGSAVELGIANVTGALVDTVLGVTSATTFDGSAVVGPNPRSPLLQEIGDQVALVSSDIGAVAGQYAASAILGLTLENTSAVDSYEVSLSAIFFNLALASGISSVADSRYSLVDSNGTIFESLVHSDPTGGNVLGTMPTGAFGGPVTDSGVSPLLYLLNPGESVVLLGEWAVAGAAVGEAAVSLAVFVASIRVDDVRQVPEPSAALILGFGLLVLGRVSRRRS